MNATQRALFLQLPALQPPHEVRPNLIDPDDLHTSERISSIISIIVATLVVAIRIFTKANVVRRMHLEDYLLLVSWVIFVAGFQTPTFMLQDSKVGAHQWNITNATLIKQLKLYYILSATFCSGIFFLKAAINLQGLRVFCPRGARDVSFYLWHASLWGNNMFYLWSTIGGLFACHPIAKSWDVAIKNRQCLNPMYVYVIAAALNTVSDVLMVLMAQRAVWNLRLNLSTKLEMSALFFVGILACVFSGIRTAYAVPLSHSDDFTYHMAMMSRWIGPEYLCGILAACLPVTPRFCSFVKAQSVNKSLVNRIRLNDGSLRRIAALSEDQNVELRFGNRINNMDIHEIHKDDQSVFSHISPLDFTAKATV